MTSYWTALAAQIGEPEGSGLVDSFMRSGPMAKIVLAILIFFSLGSWAIMFWKSAQLRRAARASDRFLDVFHKSKRFSEVNAVTGQLRSSPLVGVFQAGYAEIDAQIKSRTGAEGTPQNFHIRSLTSVERSLRRAVNIEHRLLARSLPFLATTAAATPFIGLFGTVWGIMGAFQDIGLSGSTSLDTIAPGIAEALINTAAGLGAAIPALIGYNHYAQRLRVVRAKVEDFTYEFLNLTERNFT